ncbi:MAG: hypothetical protein WA280_20420 [Xanthobacteraceae bacterium]
MRRTKAFTRSRTIPVLTAAFIGYLIGSWHPVALRAEGDASAADTVALRFPVAWDTASAATPAASAATPAAAMDDALPDSGVLPDSAAATAAPANSLSDAQLALLDPAPMAPQPRPQEEPQISQVSAPQPEVQLASAEVAAPTSARESSAMRRLPPPAMPARVQRPVKIPAVAVQRRPMNRPGYMLDDAQIASIKQRLHLTPDQEQMWPAVEAALRNIAYTRAQRLRSRGAGMMQTGDIDPESVENLKSAAVPLIMSFDDDQKQQVRDLAHVMGLDQLASEF